MQKVEERLIDIKGKPVEVIVEDPGVDERYYWDTFKWSQSGEERSGELPKGQLDYSPRRSIFCLSRLAKELLNKSP